MFVQNHYTSRKIPCGDGDGTAYWSIQPSDCAIVFIHGFLGDTTNTWLEFPSLLMSNRKFAGHDLIFYTYDTKEKLTLKGMAFKQFLSQLFDHPISLFNRSNPPLAAHRKNSTYRSVVIVAHSLGAVVARFALLAAYKEELTWLLKTRLVLFSPVHNGAKYWSLLMSTITPFKWPAPIAGGIDLAIPSLQELDPKNSEVLKFLLDETNEAQEKLTEASQRLLASQTIYGGDDRIIASPLPFSKDPNFFVVDKKGHFSVCQPSQDYDLPIRKVLEIL